MVEKVDGPASSRRVHERLRQVQNESSWMFGRLRNIAEIVVYQTLGGAGGPGRRAFNSRRLHHANKRQSLIRKASSVTAS
jgi:hypothetical protein